MRVGSISTLNISYLMRDSILSSQNRLVNAQAELASGRHYDIGLALGAGTGRDIMLRVEMADMQRFADNNKIGRIRADLTQQAISSIRAVANNFLETLTGTRNASQGQALAGIAAKSALEQLAGLLNTVHDGQHIFGGANTQAAPIAKYSGSSGEASVAAAFLAAFGMTQSDPAAQNISAATMQGFLDNQFASAFIPSAWTSTWSQASNRHILSRIDRTELVQASSTANSDPFRQLTKALTMTADLGMPGLNQAAFETIVDNALAVTGDALLGLGAEQSRLGVAQNAITAANVRLSQRLTSVTAGVLDIESVDKYEAATRVNSLMTQLETSYTLTGRISRLSLLNYI